MLSQNFSVKIWTLSQKSKLRICGSRQVRHEAVSYPLKLPIPNKHRLHDSIQSMQGAHPNNKWSHNYNEKFINWNRCCRGMCLLLIRISRLGHISLIRATNIRLLGTKITMGQVWWLVSKPLLMTHDWPSTNSLPLIFTSHILPN